MKGYMPMEKLTGAMIINLLLPALSEQKNPKGKVQNHVKR